MADAAHAADAYRYLAMAHCRLNQPIPAIPWLRKALEEADATNDWSLIGKLRIQASETYRMAGETAEALSITHRVLDDLHYYPEHETFRGLAHYPLGLIYRQRSDTESSISHYQTAVAILDRAGSQSYLVRAIENLAWVLTERDQWGEGLKLLGKSETILAGLDESQELREMHLTHLYTRGWSMPSLDLTTLRSCLPRHRPRRFCLAMVRVRSAWQETRALRVMHGPPWSFVPVSPSWRIYDCSRTRIRSQDGPPPSDLLV